MTELKDNVLKAWFAALPPAQVNYSPIDVKGSQYGMQATTPTTIESEDAFLRCGMFPVRLTGPPTDDTAQSVHPCLTLQNTFWIAMFRRTGRIRLLLSRSWIGYCKSTICTGSL